MSCIIEGNEKSLVSAGPWGGECGTRWDDGVLGSIRQMIISHGAVIDAIQIEYDTMGCVVWSEKHGGRGGVKTETVQLDYPDEYLISISGYYGNISDCGPVVVRSLMFESNKTCYGPFGFKKGTHFSFASTAGKIVGFHGRSGHHLDSIGVHLKPFIAARLAQTRMGPCVAGNRSFDVTVGMDDMLIFNSAVGEFERKEKVFTTTDGAKGCSNTRPSPIDNDEFRLSADKNFRDYETREQIKVYGVPGGVKGYSNMRQSENTTMFMTNRVFGEYDTKEKLHATPISQKQKEYRNRRSAMWCGPWGGNGGILFDDGVHTGVREIQLTRSRDVVSIKVCYDMNGQAVWGNKNGGNGGFRLDKIILDYPNEFLTQISGYYGSTLFRGPIIVKSLTFFTNKKKFGPFGDEQGIPFSSGQKDGVIVGFHGRKGGFLDCIGVHFLEGKQSPPRPSFDMYSTTTDTSNSDQVDKAEMAKEPATYESGPWDGPRDDGAFTGMRKVFLTR